jgi:hydrogenase maturation protein HypF
LFDTVAALVGFTREITFEGQAAMWLEHRARRSRPVTPYPFPWSGGELDFRPMLAEVIADRLGGRPTAEIARAFHAAVAQAVWEAGLALCDASGANVLVLSGGVFQNALLLEEIAALAADDPRISVWLNHAVPPNDGGISLGQAAMAAVHQAQQASGPSGPSRGC